MMKKFALAVLTAAGLTAATLASAQATLAAPSGGGSAQDTMSSLQGEGYQVILNKVGDAPLDQCTVSSVRPGRDVTRLDTRGDDVQREVAYTTVYLTARC